MKIYILNTEPLLSSELFSVFYEKCPQRRKDKIDSKNSMHDKVLSLGCEILTQKGFFDLGKSNFELLYSPLGKPCDKDGNVFFSLSHSGSFAAAAFSDKTIGIDIESNRDVSKKLAARFFASSEISEAQDTESIIKLWTRKEALAKAFDIPLSSALSQNVIADCGSIDGTEYFLKTIKTPDFTLSVCSSAQIFNPEIIYHNL